MNSVGLCVCVMMMIHRRFHLLLRTIQFLVAIDSVLLLLLPTAGSASRVDHELHLENLRTKALSQYHRHRQTAWRQCSDQPIPSIASSSNGRPSPASSSPSLAESKSQRGRRAAGAKSSDTAIYVSSSRGQWAGPDKSIPDHIFSVSLWCKPDGGQLSPAVILGLCVHFFYFSSTKYDYNRNILYLEIRCGRCVFLN